MIDPVWNIIDVILMKKINLFYFLTSRILDIRIFDTVNIFVPNVSMNLGNSLILSNDLVIRGFEKWKSSGRFVPKAWKA